MAIRVAYGCSEASIIHLPEHFLRIFERNNDWALPYKTRMVQHIITLKAAERIPKAMKLDEKAKLKHQAARPTKMSISQLGAWIGPIPLGL